MRHIEEEVVVRDLRIGNRVMEGMEGIECGRRGGKGRTVGMV